MKSHKKTYEDVYYNNIWENRISLIGSTLGSTEELIDRFREFYRELHKSFFRYTVNQVWLEQHFAYDGKRRMHRYRNGHVHDWTYGYFMKSVVGYNQKIMTSNCMFAAVSSYLKDFFPDFLNHDPKKEPEYFKFPYENITLDHLFFVYMVNNRLELLEEAEKRNMSYVEFVNWATNEVFCYNDEVGKEIYVLSVNAYAWPHLRNVTMRRGWSDSKFEFTSSSTVDKCHGKK